MDLWALNFDVSRLVMRNAQEIIIIENRIDSRLVQILVFRNTPTSVCEDFDVWVLGPFFSESCFWSCVSVTRRCHLCSKFGKPGQNLLQCKNNRINGRKELTYWYKALKTSDRCKLEREKNRVKISRHSRNAGKTNGKNLKNSNRLYSQNLYG